jgi:type VI secretion system secreted protein VgrG
VFFRPDIVTPKPRVWGPQTAIVTGPDGEEIHTDLHGRIKVRFHWDRQHPFDDTSSCWVRVAQTWAGPGWGAVVIPRIGMEVVVAFLDGNPDRPLVVGCVYNGANKPPYQLPDEKTKSTFKSQSTPNADGFNEFRFEDAKGSEEVFLHAQKDLNEKVENNHTLGVGVDQSYDVGQHQTITVGGDQKITVTGSQFVTVKGAPKKGDFKGSATDVTGKYTVHASDLIKMDAPNSITLECPGSSIVLEPGKITMTAGGHATIVLDANVFAKSNGGSTILLDGNACMKANGGGKVLLDANVLAQSNGGSKVVLDGNALMKANGGGKVLLTADALVEANGGGKVDLTADALLKGAKAEVNGGNVTIHGDSAVNVDGGGATGKFAGGMVKLN